MYSQLHDKCVNPMPLCFFLMEHFFVGKSAKTRLDLVKVVSMGVMSDLKGKADNAFKDMNDWLGARFLKEMERYVGSQK